MKNMLPFIFSSLFLIFITPNHTDAQAPRVVKKKTEYLNAASPDYYLVKTEEFGYNEFSDTTFHTTVVYALDSSVVDWRGFFYEYDDKRRLTKKLKRRYNPDVDLWITKDWKEYFYNENDCLIEILNIDNSGTNDPYSLYFTVNENCESVEVTSSLNSNFIQKIEYPDENNSTIYKGYYVPNVLYSKVENIFNERGEIIKESRLTLNFGVDTSQYQLHKYTYDYIQDPITGFNNTVIQQYYNNYNIGFGYGDSIIYKYGIQYDYEYLCDGSISTLKTQLVNLIANKKRITFYYDGKNECFDYDQNLDAKIYPNPSNGIINIESNIFESGDTQIQVFSMDGKYIGEQSIHSRNPTQLLDFGLLNNGIYYLRIKSEQHFITKKMIIAN